MTCPSCETRALYPKSGAFHAECDECRVQMIAESAEAFNAVEGRTWTGLETLIRRHFGDRYAEMKPRVWRAVQAVAARRKAKP